MNVTRPATSVKPTSTRTLFDGTKAHRAPRTFARGINRYTGQHDGTQPYTVSEAQEAAQMFGDLEADRREAAAYDRHVDRLAAQYDRIMSGR